MNTDNMSISGETIDYGPCAFMDYYNPKTVFSSIDQFGRYSFSNQPPITKWNLTRFAECLIPLIDKDENTSIKIATETLDNFEKIYEKKWLNMMRDKLGLFGEDSNDYELIDELLNWMENSKADYTNSFCYLMDVKLKDQKIYEDIKFSSWFSKWEKRRLSNSVSKQKSLDLMRSSNPIVIPRNHNVEKALTLAGENKLEYLNKLLSILKKPYEINEDYSDYQIASNNNEYQTFCGT